MIATCSLVLLLALHGLKIATHSGSGAFIKDFCSRILYDCDAVGTSTWCAGNMASHFPSFGLQFTAVLVTHNFICDLNHEPLARSYRRLRLSL